MEEPDSKPEKWFFGDDYHCKNMYDEKVRCHNNPNNRPFDMAWSKGLVFTILQGLWAGPHTIPGETVNGETVRIGKYGNVLSGQHQGTALILADEVLQMDRARPDYDESNARYPFWNGYDHPFIETIVVTGLSEDERVLRTIDYVKPRTAADMLYTMPLFRDNTSPQRKEMTRMLAAAVDVLWDRTKAKGYRTHPEIVGFLERHPKLLDMIEHIFTENSANGADGGRKISKLKLSPGMCAALGYLMACSGSEDENYIERYKNGKPPSEKFLDFSMMDKAKEFWTRMAGGRSFIPVRHKLHTLPGTTPVNYPDTDNLGMGGKTEEKLAVVAKAWDVWAAHPGIDGDDGDNPPFKTVKNPDGTTSYPDLEKGGSLFLSYTNLSPTKITNKGSTGGEVMPDGKIRLIDIPDFGGIDDFVQGEESESDESEPDAPMLSREEIEAAAADQKKRREEEEERKKEEDAVKRRRQEHQRKLKGGTGS